MLLLSSCLSFVVHCSSHLHLVAFYFSDFRRKPEETGVPSASLTILERASPCLEFHLACRDLCSAMRSFCQYGLVYFTTSAVLEGSFQY